MRRSTIRRTLARVALAALALVAAQAADPRAAARGPDPRGAGAVSAPVGGTSTVRVEPILRRGPGALVEARASSPAAPSPAPRDAAVASVRSASGPRGRLVTLRRAIDCQPHARLLALRTVLACHGEERATVDLGAAEPALEAIAAPPDALAPGGLIVPSELARAFRVCPYAPDPALDARPDLFVPYEDRDVGRCYLWAPLPAAGLAAAGAYDRRDYLATIHPLMRAVIRRAIAESAAAGHRFRVISGTRPGGKASWHTFGLAVDVQIEGRKGLKEATRAFLAGGEEHDAWVAFAETCERLGLYWLGRRDPDEIFHFEWRPGFTGLPRGEVAAGLAADLERGGLAAVWQRLRYDGRRPSALRHLRDDAAPELSPPTRRGRPSAGRPHRKR